MQSSSREQSSSTATPFRALWAQVVQQAKDDVDSQPVDSVLYEQAAAFFAGGGAWAESRRTVADMLDVHPDDLRRGGVRWIAERRERDGLPDAPPPVVLPVSRPTPAPLPLLVALPAETPPPRRPKTGLGVNPFFPGRRIEHPVMPII
jgi:hypothetical protein